MPVREVINGVKQPTSIVPNDASETDDLEKKLAADFKNHRGRPLIIFVENMKHQATKDAIQKAASTVVTEIVEVADSGVLTD